VSAPQRFAAWLDKHQHVDRRFGHVYRYHSRSDAHSIALCEEIIVDLLKSCQPLREQAALGLVVYGINYEYRFSSGKRKTLDLAIGTAVDPLPPAGGAAIRQAAIHDLLISCEAKTVMTEHGKSKPRVYDELSSSHEIVHQGRPEAIATGVTVVNIAKCFVSPLRQKEGNALHVSEHKQPSAAAGMVKHLHALPVRDAVGTVGFDAYASIVIDCENLPKRPVSLCTAPPAPQPGDHDHYDTFVERVSRFYAERFSKLADR
jgi:hypothetical protein